MHLISAGKKMICNLNKICVFKKKKKQEPKQNHETK